jgi:AraC family transcriptional regulator
MEEPTIKAIDAMEVISMSFTGSYEQTSDMLDELMSWLLREGHPYSGRPFAIFYDDPAKVEEADLRAEVCLPVSETIEVREPIEKKTVEGGDFAAAIHNGPYSSISDVYDKLSEWIASNDYSCRQEMGTREVFHKLIGEVENPGELVTEVQIPVIKA